VVISKNNKADITSIMNIVVMRLFEKNKKESQKVKLNLVIKESYMSLDEK
jgi:hypothetical protein